MRRLHVVSLGCQMSVADSEDLARPLIERGLRPVAAPEDADAIILNTCTVRQHAEDKALSLLGRLREWKEKDPERVLVVAGCAAERLGDWISRRFPYVDLVVGAKSAADYPRLIEEALAYKFDGVRETRQGFGAAPGIPVGWESATTAFVTIMRGCNYSCSYCIVPLVRGRESYRPPEEILDEVRAKAAAGAREIVLLGQTVNSWRAADAAGRERRFPDLLRLAAEIEGVESLRFESPHPFFVDDALAAAMAQTPQVSRLLHLPLQSGSDRILKLMRRNYTAGSFLDKAARLRAVVPGIEFATDVIVGFSSESDEDFERTLETVATLRPVLAYTFKYSPREGTEAAERPDDVPAEVKEARLARLNDLCGRLSAAEKTATAGETR